MKSESAVVSRHLHFSWVIFLLLFPLLGLHSQSIYDLTHWPLPASPVGVFYRDGVVHHRWNARLADLAANRSWSITGMRSSFNVATGTERLVIDFSSHGQALTEGFREFPSIYGHIRQMGNIILDLYNTTVDPSFDGKVKMAGVSKKRKTSAQGLLQTVDFFLLEPNVVTIDFSFSQQISVEAFYLFDGTRLVIDVKKA